LNEFEIQENRFFVIFLPFLFATHILTVNCVKITEKTKQPAYEIFERIFKT